ncbi:hypothetical protein [Saezia sanguinis]|uniref:hypothetical protein n=1 Tax=Saezia sanguinis TaxID=1965230 RepID=UPI003025614F
MTVTTDICKAGPYEGDGVTAVFAVNFRFLDAAHLHVWYEQEQHKTVLVLGRDYTVAGVGQSEGRIHLSQPLVVGQALMIRREVPVTQLADYVQGDAFPAESHEMALDKLTMIAQQLKDGVDRAVKTTDGEEQQPVELPALNDRKNKLLGFDGQGLPESVTIGSGLKLAEQMLMVKPGMGIVSNEAGVSVLIGDGLGMFDNAVVVKLGKGLEFDEQARAQVQEELIKSVSSGSASIIELKGLIAHLTQRVEDLETGEGGEVAIYIGDGIRYDAQGRLTVKPGLGIQVDADGVSVILGEGLETGNQGQVQVSQALREGVSQLSGQMTQVTAGTTFPFNQDLCAEIGGYSKGAVLLGADGVTLWQSTVDANMTDPNSGSANGWIRVVNEDGLAQYLSDRFAIIYPNGGSAANPATISFNNRYTSPNPFPEHYVTCQIELYDKGEWSPISFSQLTGAGGIGVVAAQFNDNIVIQTGSNSLFGSAGGTGNLFTSPTSATTSAPCRVKVWRID